MLGEFVPVIILLGVAALVCTAMVSLSWILGPKRITTYKQSPYECGVAPLGDAFERVPVKFYLVAILFVLFDIEVVFLWSWISVYQSAPIDYKLFSFVAMAIYFALWILGDAYAIRVNAIDWDESTSLAEEKLNSSPALLPTKEAKALEAN